jgi:hypothetical protein
MLKKKLKRPVCSLHFPLPQPPTPLPSPSRPPTETRTKKKMNPPPMPLPSLGLCVCDRDNDGFEVSGNSPNETHTESSESSAQNRALHAQPNRWALHSPISHSTNVIRPKPVSEHDPGLFWVGLRFGLRFRS